MPGEMKVYARSYDATMDRAWAITERIIRQLDFEVVDDGATLRIAYAPSRAAVYAEDWSATRRKYGLSAEAWDVHRVASKLSDICERSGIPFLDLTPMLQAAAELGRDGERVYFKRDGHWTPEGNARVAQALARFLEEHL